MNLLGYPEPPRPRGGNRGGASNQIKKKLGNGDVELRVGKSLCFPGGCGAPGGGESARESILTETGWPGSVQPGARLVPGGFQFHRGLVPVGSNFAAAWLQCGVHFARTWLQACCDFAAAWYQSGAHLVRTWSSGLGGLRLCVCVCVCVHPSL